MRALIYGHFAQCLKCVKNVDLKINSSARQKRPLNGVNEVFPRDKINSHSPVSSLNKRFFSLTAHSTNTCLKSL